MEGVRVWAGAGGLGRSLQSSEGQVARTWIRWPREPQCPAGTGGDQGWRSLGEDLGDVCCLSHALTDNPPPPGSSTEPSPRGSGLFRSSRLSEDGENYRTF